MARTKQTARKGTGGKYPKAKFGDQADADDEHSDAEPEPEPGTSEDTQQTKQTDPNVYIAPRPRPKPKVKKGAEKRKGLPPVKRMTIEQKIRSEQKKTDTCCSKRYFQR